MSSSGEIENPVLTMCCQVNKGKASAHSSLLGEIQAFPEGGFTLLDNIF